ncbi:MAG: hypothetical protein PHU03_08365 [Syntrophales bacterium]|nr:hypothetical protein [Syntrophales bacterium]
MKYERELHAAVVAAARLCERVRAGIPAVQEKSGDLIAQLLDEDLKTTDTETSIELNFAVLKFKQGACQ